MERELTAIRTLVDTATGFAVEYGFQALGAVIVILLGMQAAKWVSRIVLGVCERRGLDVTLSRFFANVVRIVVLVFVAIIALGKFGITIAPFIAALGAIAFGSSLALQGPLSNYGAGLAIILGRPFVVGNTIMVRGVGGIVEEVTLAATVLVTEDGERITIPNRQVVGEILHNSYASRLVESTVGIGFETDPETTIDAVRAALAAIEGVCAEPAPQVGIEEFAQSGVVVGVRYWVPTERYHQTRFEANRGVYAALRARGIAISCPRRDVRLLREAAARA